VSIGRIRSNAAVTLSAMMSNCPWMDAVIGTIAFMT
jgi:hypothetical protein